MRVILLIAFRNLVQARRRSGLLGLAIALVTALLVFLMALSAGVEQNMVKAATTVSAGHVNVAGFFKPTTGSSSPIVTGKTALRQAVEAAVPEIDYIVERDRGWGKIISETGSVQSGLSGLVLEQEQRLVDSLQLAKESEYVDGGRDEVLGRVSDLATDRNGIVLFADQARRLGVTVGDSLTIKTETMSGASNTVDVRVVAVARDLGMLSGWSSFVNRSLCLELYQLNDDTTGAIWVYLQDIDDAPAVMGRLREVLPQQGFTVRDHDPNPFFFKFDTVQGEDWAGQQIDLTVWKDEVSFVAWILQAMDTISVFVTLLLVFVIAVGIMNSMWNAVRERTKEIGTVRAIGLTRGRVLVLFMVEAVLLGLFGAGAGALLGAGLALAVDAAAIHVPWGAVQAVLLSDTIHLAVRGQALVGSVIFLTGFTALSALWPSLRAAWLQPVDALRHAE
jgi:putative ABC transport system permease protein